MVDRGLAAAIISYGVGHRLSEKRDFDSSCRGLGCTPGFNPPLRKRDVQGILKIQGGENVFWVSLI